MILPIYAYGNPVLKKVAVDITPDYPNLDELLENMWETLRHSNGIGLAAPQIGLSIRLFLVDTEQLNEARDEENQVPDAIKQVFINAQIIEEDGEEWSYEEGCLSIPDVSGEVDRPERVRIQYQDEQFQTHEKVFEGMNARVIQHEYDHIDGILFTEHLKPVKKQLIRRKLESIRKGKAKADYPMKFYSKKQLLIICVQNQLESLPSSWSPI